MARPCRSRRKPALDSAECIVSCGSFFAVTIVTGSVVLGLFSFVVFLYGYENGGRTVTLGGNQVDAQISGVLGLLVAVVRFLAPPGF